MVNSFSGINITGIVNNYLNANISGFIDSLILHKEGVLEIQKENIGFWYSQIQSIFGWMAILGIVMFISSYIYIFYQAKRTINKIKKEKDKLENEYKELISITKNDIQDIKDENQFVAILQKGFTLKALKRFDEALDLYDDLLGQQYVGQNNDRKYTVYREIADAHYLIGEATEEIYENAGNYFNAIQAMEKAMEIYIKQEDETFLVTLQDKYNRLFSSNPSEE